MSFFAFVSSNYEQIFKLLLAHIKLTAISVGVAVLIGVPLGILISYASKASKPVLSVANIIQAIPSMALLGFMIPLLGIGTVPAIVTVVLYSLLPIIKNTYIGIDNINPQQLEAAKGIGLTRLQVLFKIQIPLALPVIMAGVRIASVTAVGLMTMAAFIGAGGLGDLVFAGIRTVNNDQILAGAIPACLLALLVDFLIGLIEKLVTPISLQKGDNTIKLKKRNSQKAILGVSAAAIAAIFIITSIGGGAPKNSRIMEVGSKDHTESHILAYMVADLVEGNTDISVNRKVNLGGTQVCFSALNKRDIDMYVEYSGTAYGDTLAHPPISDMQEVYDTVKEEFKSRYDIEVLKQMSFNNTYTLAVTPETAEKYGLETISDFARVAPNLTSGTTFEFLNRKDGLPGLQEKYGFTLKQTLGMDSSPRYLALDNGEVDVIDAFATDGLLKKFNLKTLEDDKSFFPPYYAMPVMTNEAMKEFPEVIPLLEKLGDLLTNEVMTELNYKVDDLKEEPENVARDFLLEHDLIAE